MDNFQSSLTIIIFLSAATIIGLLIVTAIRYIASRFGRSK